ncbi:MAG: LamG domain-containing protein [Deltaproteobacteria bacterium]|nr:LamG domain-containing protein [Deltaproteobacteria bacterium]
MPGDFTIAWDGSDPDGNEDLASYTVTVTSNGGEVITCSNLTENRLVGGGDYRSVCQLKRTGYGEMVTPLTLGAKSDYRMEVKAVDYQGLSSSPVVGIGTILDNNLVSWWRFEEGSGSGARDSTGLNTGLLSGPQWVSGVSGKGLLFNGTSDYVALSSNGFPTGASSRSVFLWFRWDEAIAGGDCQAYRNPFWYGSEVNDGMNRIDLSGCSTPTVRLVGINNDTTPVTTGMTQGVLGYTYDGKMVRIYWNGVLISEEEKGWNTVPGMAEIGRRVGANSFKGALDEVSIYNRALSVDEIRRDCRRTFFGHGELVEPCPDPRSPIILLPTPGMKLPPTKALFAWRGEKDPAGRMIYPDSTYQVSYQIFADGLGMWTEATQLGSITTGYYVNELGASSVNKKFRLNVTPNDNSNATSTRTFSTTAPVVSWWSFNEGSGDAIDSIRGINGQLISGLLRTPGISGSALSFDDRSNYINLGNAARLKFDTGSSFMIESWVRRNSADSPNDDTIFSKMDMTDPTGRGYNFAILSGGQSVLNGSANTVDFMIRSQNNANRYIEGRTETTITDTNWHHVAMSYAGSRLVDVSSIRLYIDGQSQKVIPVVNALSLTESADTPAEARIGASRSWGGDGGSVDNVFNGLMDEVMVYQDDANPSNLSPAVICNSYLTTCFSAGLSCDFSCVPQ